MRCPPTSISRTLNSLAYSRRNCLTSTVSAQSRGGLIYSKEEDNPRRTSSCSMRQSFVATLQCNSSRRHPCKGPLPISLTATACSLPMKIPPVYFRSLRTLNCVHRWLPAPLILAGTKSPLATARM